MMQVLSFGLGVSFGDRVALAGVDLSIQGGVTVVLGPNGAGKSTLLRCLATVLAPDAGSLLLDGMNPQFEADRIEIRRRLGYLPQQHGLSGPHRVFDTMDLLAVMKEAGDERRRRTMVFDALERVGLSDRAGESLDDLSGGMRQRVGVAQALLTAPRLLVLDEPAAGLDPDERRRLREILAERRQRATVVVSTHLTEEATHADTVVVMSEGDVRFVGSPGALAERARGCAWVQPEPPTQPVRASWQQADGSHRCLGTAPEGASAVSPTLEDGYLLTI
jgi:ABC-2 type transport system ATP-binding protein